MYEDKSGEFYIADIVTEKFINIKMSCLLHSFHIIKKNRCKQIQFAIRPISPWRRGARRNGCIRRLH